MKKIVIPTPGLTSHGGVRILVDIANKLVARGCDVTFFVPNRAAVMPFLLDDRVLVKKIGIHSNNKIVAGVTFLASLPMHLVKCNILANQFSTVFPAWLASCILGAKYVYLVQGLEYRVYGGKLYRVIKLLCEWTYRKGKVIAANPYLSSELKKYREVSYTLQLGVSQKFFTMPCLSPVKDFDIIYFLRAEKHKRVDRFDILLSFFVAKHFRILCVSQNLELLNAYSNRVTTLCPKNDDEIIEALDKSKILLLTSDYEGFALPPLEAMARGLPSVIFECGGPTVYALHERNCMIVRDGQEQTALQFTERLLMDSSFYSELSKNALATASRFKLEDAINDLADYLMKIY